MADLLTSSNLPATDNVADYFDRVLARIHAIRASEQEFWQKVAGIYATSADYDVNSPLTRAFFRAVQNKFHYAIHGHTAADLIASRANASKPNMGLTSWKNGPAGPIRRSDVSVGKNYLTESELSLLDLIMDQYLSFAELQARMHRSMRMVDWLNKLNDFLALNERRVLSESNGGLSHKEATAIAEAEYDKYTAKTLGQEAGAGPLAPRLIQTQSESASREGT